MSYLDLSERLKSLVAYEPDEIDLGEGLILSNHEFKSRSTAAPSIGPERAVPEALREALPEVDLSSLFVTPDDEIAENALFRYHVMRLKKSPKAEAAIILLHGFNERHWDKYLPMAESLVRATGRAVFLFPIAFHMNRSPSLWHNSRLMGKVSHYRKKSFPDVIQSTLSNAAISVRLHADPSRFFWSGLQSYEDVVSLAAD
ncbi:MAG: DUF6051 family protein, partial [Deltaproteobacteria bacterium]|nr:DUF6051 family protein [Deltaproteobacteria bacterium]